MARVKDSIRAQYRGRGDLKKTENFLSRIVEGEYLAHADEYAEKGVKALYEATPKRTGKTAASWTASLDGRGRKGQSTRLTWSNSNIQNHVNIALILDQGHVTKGGNWVEGRHYIEPALDPVIKEMSDNIWEEVTK